MMRTHICLYIFFGYVTLSSCVFILPSITQERKDALLMIFRSSLSDNPGDLRQSYYSVAGYEAMDSLNKIEQPNEVCRVFVKELHKPIKFTNDSLENIFYAIHGVIMMRQKCGAIENPKEIVNYLTDHLKKEQLTSRELYFCSASLHHLGFKGLGSIAMNVVNSIYRKDMSAANMGYLFQTIALVHMDAKHFSEHITESISSAVSQADEVDGTYSHFDSGLYTTAFTVDGMLRVSEKLGIIPKLSDRQISLFANYFLHSCRFVHQPREAYHLIRVLRLLGTNNIMIPVSFTASKTLSLSDMDVLVLEARTVWGDPVQLDISLVGAKKDDSAAQLIAKTAPFKYREESRDYVLDIFNNFPSVKERAHYILFLSASPIKTTKNTSHELLPNYIGITGVPLRLKVTAPIQLPYVKFEVRDKNSANAHVVEKLSKIGDKLSSAFPTLHTHQILECFIPIVQKLWDMKLFRPHQTFLRLEHKESGREIILVAQPSAKYEQKEKDIYMQKITISIEKNAGDFSHLSGIYDAELILGDVLADKMILWRLGSLDFDFPSPPVNPASSSQTVHWHDRPSLRGSAMPEIEHTFREQEKRASSLFAWTFTLLCSACILILVIGWSFIGINLNALKDTSLYGIAFHLCLGSIFLLYYFYWRQLNMFSTLKYLSIIGVPTFYTGNRMLAVIAARRVEGKNGASGDSQ